MGFRTKFLMLNTCRQSGLTWQEPNKKNAAICSWLTLKLYNQKLFSSTSKFTTTTLEQRLLWIGFVHWIVYTFMPLSQQIFTCSEWTNVNTKAMCEICSMLTLKTAEQRYWDHFLVYLLLTSDKFCKLFWCFHCWLWTSECRLGLSNQCSYINVF